MIDEAIVELEPMIGVRAACRATGRAQASHYRRHRPHRRRCGRSGNAGRSPER
jgi:hypothetical protein